MRAPFQKLRTDDQDLMQLQDNVEAALKSLIGSPLVDSVLVRSVALTNAAAGVPVSHGLGRTPLGFVVTRGTVGFGGSVFEAAASPSPDRYLLIRTSAGTTTADILFF